jgi:phosphate starvation-inducible protein PhoH and related proteins
MAKRQRPKAIQSSNTHMKPITIHPLTENQDKFFDNYSTGKSQVLLGSAGVGKTFIASYLALKEIEESNMYRKLIIVRSAVPTREQGFLKGDLGEKEDVYKIPYKKIVSDIYHRDDAWDILTKHDVVQFTSTSYLRGLTLDNSIVLMDEFQSATSHELATVLTRLGQDSKILFCGDYHQTDLTKASDIKGAHKFIHILENMPDYFDINRFTEEDIVRSGIVKDFIIKQNKLYPEGL